MTSYKTETETLKDKYIWLTPIVKETTSKVKNSDGEYDEVTEKKLTDCSINSSKLRSLLEDSGFFNLEISGSKFLLRLFEGSVEIWDEDKLKSYFDTEYIRNYPEKGIHDIPKEMLENKFLNSKENLLKDSIIKRLRPKDSINFLEHTAKAAYFPYLNGVVEVTATNIKLLKYSEAKGVVFKTNILPRNFTEKMKKDWERGNWSRFVKNISSGENGKSRFDDFQTVIGYLLHKYFEKKLKAIIFLDSRGSGDNPKGRGGKTLLGKGLGYMLNAEMKTDKVYCEIDGKNLKREDKGKYQEAEINTSLIHLNDVEQRGQFAFKLESVYNDILEGMKVKKLYKDPFHIRTKMIISSNHTFNTESGSTKDRFLEVQLSGYYDENNSPYDEFGKWFFSSDWTESDWNDFDNMMLFCVQRFLEKGLKAPENINLYQLKAINESSTEFIEFMEAKRLAGEIYHNCAIDKGAYKIQFCALYPEHNWLMNKDKSWNKWLRAYTFYHPYFVRYTTDRHNEFDKVKAFENGSSYRSFKYFFTQEHLVEQAKTRANEL